MHQISLQTPHSSQQCIHCILAQCCCCVPRRCRKWSRPHPRWCLQRYPSHHWFSAYLWKLHHSPSDRRYVHFASQMVIYVLMIPDPNQGTLLLLVDLFCSRHQGVNKCKPRSFSTPQIARLSPPSLLWRNICSVEDVICLTSEVTAFGLPDQSCVHSGTTTSFLPFIPSPLFFCWT